MGKNKISREVTEREVNCLENLVVAYNTLFLVSSIFIISLAGTVKELFGDIIRLLSPSVLLLTVGGFIVVVAIFGYVGIARRSSFLISLYTLLLVYALVMEFAGGLGILSYRREIKSMVSNKMTKAMNNYYDDPLTANMVDYYQLELRCCGANSFQDWQKIENRYSDSTCKVPGVVLPPSCCTKVNSTYYELNKRGCMPAINYYLHRSGFLLTSTIIAICTIQILGAYFSYTLASSINKYKIQQLNKYNTPQQSQEYQYPEHNEKINHF